MSYCMHEVGEVADLQKKMMGAIEKKRQIEEERKMHRASEYDDLKTELKKLDKMINESFEKEVVDSIRRGSRGVASPRDSVSLDTCEFKTDKGGGFTVIDQKYGSKNRTGILVKMDNGRRKTIPAGELCIRPSSLTPLGNPPLYRVEGFTPPMKPIASEHSLDMYEFDLMKIEKMNHA